MVQMVPVQSSNVKAIGHDPETQELHVHFHNGGQYVYAEVPAEKHQALVAADSIGNHLHAHIKGKHAHRRL